MVAPRELQDYLQSVCRDYAQWWTLYTLIDVQSKVRERTQKSQTFLFDFGLMVERKIENSRRQKVDNSEAQGQIERLPVLEALRKHENEHVLLVGRPGSGKSTTLARLLLDLAKEAIDNPDALIPVLLELRYSDSGSVQELIRNAFKRYKLRLNLEQINELLFQQRLWLLIDGVNELPDDISELERFRRGYPEVPMVFTTRDTEWDSTLGVEQRLEMQPLTPEQIQRFIKAYLPGSKANFFSQHFRGQLRKLGQVPLLLWMLCELFEEIPNQQLPSNLAEVFRVFTQKYEKKSERKHEVAALKGDVKPLSERQLWFRALKHLSLVMMNGKTPSDFRSIISREEAEQEIRKLFYNEPYPDKTTRNCLSDLLKYHLLQVNNSNRIEFRHPLIQEYYAAEALLTQLQEKHLDLVEDTLFQQKYLNCLKWSEVISLMLALVDDEVQAKRIVYLALDTDLIFGMRLAGELKEKLQRKLMPLVVNKTKSILSQASPRNDTSKSLIIYLLSLTRSRFIISDLRADKNYQDAKIRLTLASVLDKFGEPGYYLLAEMIADHDEEVRKCVAITLGKIYVERAVGKLYILLKDSEPEVRRCAALALGRLVSGLDATYAREAICKLKDLLKDSELGVIRCTVIAIARIKSDFAITVLTNSLKSENKHLSQYSAIALGRIRSEDSVNQLSQALENQQAYVRRNAAYGLVNAGSSKVVPHLTNAIPYLVRALEDRSSAVRIYAVIALGNIGSNYAVNNLIKALQNKTEKPIIRCKIVEALGRIGSDIVVDDLIQVFQDRSSEEKLRESVIYALDHIGSRKSIHSLIEALKNGYHTSKNQIMIARILSRRLSRSEIDCLIQDIECKEKLALQVFHVLHGFDQSIKNGSFYLPLEAVINDLIRAIHMREFSYFEEEIAVLRVISSSPQSLELLKFLPTLKMEWLKTGVKSFKKIMIAIQDKCKLYNYDIVQLPMSYETEGNEQEIKKVSEKSERIIYTQNYYEQGTHTHTHNYTNDKDLRQQITELRQLVTQLQQDQQPKTEAEANEILDVKFHEIQKTNLGRWQRLKHQLHLLKRQLLNPERHFTASKATLGEVAKHYLEDSVVAKALITYLDTLSADTDQGE